MSKTNRGDLAKVRRMLAQVDNMLALTSDDTALNSIPYKEIEAFEAGLRRARQALANTLAFMGDTSGWTTSAPAARSKAKEHEYAVRQS